jgi:hypothetical protein
VAEATLTAEVMMRSVRLSCSNASMPDDGSGSLTRRRGIDFLI